MLTQCYADGSRTEISSLAETLEAETQRLETLHCEKDRQETFCPGSQVSGICLLLLFQLRL